nr:homeodomain transcription factor bW [Pseudozyma flocculosa]
MEYTTFLTRVINLVSELRAALPQARNKTNYDTQNFQVMHLEVVCPDEAGLRQDLDQRGVSSDFQRGVLQIYYKALHQLNRAYQRHYSDACFDLQRCGDSDEDFHQKFRKALSSGYSFQARKIWGIIVQEIGAEQISLQESIPFPESFSHTDMTRRDCFGEATGKTTRGHGAEATRILEQAFSYTETITPAERIRLAELTGLKQHQVTIWFQNRRNRNNGRKGKKGQPLQPIVHSPSEQSPPKHGSPVSSSPTRDFNLSEKKRKSYGALGRASSDDTDSDSDSPSSLLKRPRLPSSGSEVSGSSYTSDGVASSVDHMLRFSPWNTPSSGSTSSSSISSSQEGFWESPHKPHGVFEHMNRKHSDRANASMPNLTMATPPQNVNQSLQLAQVSAFSCDAHNGSPFKVGGLHFGDLQLDVGGLFDKELRENIQMALSMSSSEQGSYRSVSSSSWGSHPVTTDDDEWSDIDESDAVDVGRHTTPMDAMGSGQQSLTPPEFQVLNTAELGQVQAQSLYLHSATNAQAAADTNSNADTNLSNMFDTDSFDLSHLFEIASQPTHVPASSPFAMHHQASLPVDAHISAPRHDLTLQMSDLEQLLDIDILSSALSGSQHSGDATMQSSEAQLCMTFDISSNAFSVV